MCPACFAVATLHVSLTCGVALCFVTRFLCCSPAFCAQHRLSPKLMVEAAATRKHLQASCCGVAVWLLLAYSTSPPMQRVVAQAFPSARPDIVDAAFAAPPSAAQLRLLQVLLPSPLPPHLFPLHKQHFLIFTSLTATPPCCFSRSSCPDLQTAIRFKEARIRSVQRG